MSEMSPEMMQALIQAMMAQDSGRAGLEQERLAYQAMGPEGFKQHVGMGTLDERSAMAAQESQVQQDMVAKQLAQIESASAPRNQNYGNAGANIMGGIGDIARQMAGAYRSNKLMGQQKDMAAQAAATQKGFLDQKDAGRLAAGDARYKGMQQWIEAQKAGQTPGMVPGQTAGFGVPGLQMDPALSPQPTVMLPGMASLNKPKRIGPDGIPLPDPSFYGL